MFAQSLIFGFFVNIAAVCIFGANFNMKYFGFVLAMSAIIGMLRIA